MTYMTSRAAKHVGLHWHVGRSPGRLAVPSFPWELRNGLDGGLPFDPGFSAGAGVSSVLTGQSPRQGWLGRLVLATGSGDLDLMI